MILLTGASGFVGGATLAALAARGAKVRAVSHTRPPATTATETVRADLTDPASLGGLCDGVDTVVHLASYIGDDEEACAAVNMRGTDALLAEARRAGVSRTLYLSTAAVYGDGIHQGPAEDELPPAPASPLSRSRLAAEHSVLATGGLVLRPMFVYGPGDVWFVPTLARALAAMPVTVNRGAARISLVAVADLAEAIAVLATTPWASERILHAAHPTPVSVAELTRALVAGLGVPEPTADIGFDDALAFLSAAPDLARRLRLLAFDHFYDGSRLWHRTGVRPGDFAGRFAAAAPWYRRHLEGAP